MSVTGICFQRSNAPTLQHSNTPTLQHSNTPTRLCPDGLRRGRRFNSSTLPRFNNSTSPFNDSTIQRFNVFSESLISESLITIHFPFAPLKDSPLIREIRVTCHVRSLGVGGSAVHSAVEFSACTFPPYRGIPSGGVSKCVCFLCRFPALGGRCGVCAFGPWDLFGIWDLVLGASFTARPLNSTLPLF